METARGVIKQTVEESRRRQWRRAGEDSGGEQVGIVGGSRWIQ